MNDVEIQIVPFGSTIYEQTITLRDDVLRKPIGLAYTPEQLALEHDEVHIAAVLNGNVIGVLLLRKGESRVLKMRQVAVATAFQRCGIGHKLVVFAEKFAKENNFVAIELHARESALAFYKSLHYTQIGDEFTEVGLPHFKMKKLIL
ncbi:MAG: GNAT family N-acetyltransferase [Chitinophagales bacterium]|nr:GNAT family N-acetyltransferase [Chitinophagales bacterium]HMW11957.1 GNAT family N-acetyltransferase [Chitinophagales bacterium]HMX59583.1 GNAT family N-acetyltransferase [Chitinophagales bacterium]HMZ33044.1 GNAT family N-acetyltransferase [Chitinophagales bacterium]HNC70876.1 GNAT family N-acetyltransferase [Chitinophagales bacterium]